MRPSARRRLGAILERRDAELVEPVPFRSDAAAVLEVRKHRAAPQGERMLERRKRLLVACRAAVSPRGLDQFFELGGVEPLGLQSVPLAVPLDLEPGLAQVRDVHLQRVRGARGRPLAPDRVDQGPVGDGRAAREH